MEVGIGEMQPQAKDQDCAQLPEAGRKRSFSAWSV